MGVLKAALLGRYIRDIYHLHGSGAHMFCRVDSVWQLLHNAK